MTTLLEQQVTIVLTNALGRAPTAEEIRLGTLGPYPLSDIHNTANIAENTLSISPTSDDTIQEAIDKINSNGGGVVYLNPGTYNVSSDITLPSSVYLVGLVKNLCIIDFGGGSHSIVISGKQDVTLQEITIQDSSDSGVKISSNTGPILINNIDVIDCAIGLEATSCLLGINIIGGGMIALSCGVGLKFDGVTGFLIDNSSFGLNTGYGMELIDTDFGIIRSCFFQANGDDAINCSNVDATAFESLIIIQNTGDGMNISGGSVANRIVGCRISVNDNGIVLANSASLINNVISSNSISSNTVYGVVVAGANATNNLIIGNTILSNGTGAVSDSGTTTLIRSNIGQADN